MRRRRGNESRKHGKQKSSGSVRPCFRETAIVVVIVVQHFLPPSPVRRGMTQKFCALPPSGVTVSTIRPGLAWPGQPERQSQHRTHQQVKGNEQGPDGPEPPVATHPFLPSFLPSFGLVSSKGRSFYFLLRDSDSGMRNQVSTVLEHSNKEGLLACLLASFVRSFFLSFFQERQPTARKQFRTMIEILQLLRSLLINIRIVVYRIVLVSSRCQRITAGWELGVERWEFVRTAYGRHTTCTGIFFFQ